MLLSHRPSQESAASNVISLANHPLTIDRRDTSARSAVAKPDLDSTTCVSTSSTGRSSGSASTGIEGDSLQSTSSDPGSNLIHFFDKMIFQASIEMDDLLWIRGHFTVRVRHQIMSSVRKLLCEEFGRRMVERNQLLFTVQHRDVNTLIAGLLRVQFYANQILLPEYNVFGDRVEQNGVTVTWGVGRSIDEAKHERIKKRKRRNLRRR